MKRIVVLLSTLLWAAQVSAVTQTLCIELLVLQHQTMVSGEVFPSYPALPQARTPILPKQPDEQCTQQFNADKLSEHYTILYHTTWQHAFTDHRATQFVLHTTPTSLPMWQQWIAQPHFIEASYGIPQVYGVLTLRNQSYIEITPHFVLSALIARNQRLPIVLQQTQRSRLNEVHYFDNPYFGLLIQIRPLPN